jgi:hypothetical protein
MIVKTFWETLKTTSHTQKVLIKSSDLPKKYPSRDTVPLNSC